MALTPEQEAFYHREGYLVIEKLIPDDTLAELHAVIADLREEAADLTESSRIFDVAPGHSRTTPKLRRIKDPVLRHPVFDALMRSDLLADVVAPLLGGTARFDHSKLNFKPSGGNAAIEWHQDWAFYPHTNDDLLAVGVMLEDCGLENGPLQVIPGSHKGPVLDHHLNGMFVGGVRPDTVPDLDKAVSLTAPAGSISIHHVRTLHASSENRSDRERPLLLYSYSAVDAYPVFEHRPWAEYEAGIVRGGSMLEPRYADVPARMPYPRDDGADSIFDNQAALMAAS